MLVSHKLFALHIFTTVQTEQADRSRVTLVTVDYYVFYVFIYNMRFIIYRQMIGDRNYHIHGTVVTYTDPWSFLLNSLK